MQDELTRKISFQEKVRNIKNLLMYVYGIDKTYYILASAQLMLEAVEAALVMVLSADILELLYKSAPFAEIRKPVVLLLGLSFLLSFASCILKNEFVLPKEENIAKTYDGNLAAKFQQMDYSLMESPYVKKMTERIDNANQWGAGVYNLFESFRYIVSGICRIVCSAAVAFPILRIIAVSRNMWMYLGLAVLVTVPYFLTKAVAKVNALMQQKLLEDPDGAYPEELLRKYYCSSWHWVRRCMSGDYHFIKDIHLYDGHGLMRHYTAENMRAGEEVMPKLSLAGKLNGRVWSLNGLRTTI